MSKKAWFYGAVMPLAVLMNPVGAPAAPADQSAAPQASASQASAGNDGLQEIVVTANRRSESKQDVPIAIEAFSSDQLQAAGISGVADLGTITPGLVMGNQGGYLQPRLRGVGTLAVSPGDENPIALYVDGVYYASMPGAMLDLANVASVEVDKGPQGTLFGRNATGGLIQITTLDPKPDFQGWASVGYGNYNTVEADEYVTGALTKTLSTNLAAYYQDQGEGFGRNAFNGEYVNQTRDLSLRNKWLFQPSDDTQFKLVLDFEEVHYTPTYVPAPGTTPLGGPPYTGSPQGIDGYYQPYGFTQQGGSSLQINHDFGFAHFLSTTAYRETGTTISEDGALTPNYAYTLNLPWFEEHHQLSQEFQLQSEADSKIKWTGGIYLFDADGSWNPIIAEGGLEAPYTYYTYSDQKAYSGAVFGQATKEIFPDTDLTLGARYTVERRNFHGTDTYTVNDGPQLFGGYDEEHTIFQKPTWRASLDHHFSPDLMAYVSYNTGFKSGGYNDTLVPTVKFQPETLADYEVGTKADFLDHHLRLDVAAFYYDYKNLQEVRYPDGVEDIYNAPAATIYGLDIDLNAKLIPNLTATIGLELLRDYYTNFPDAPISTPAGPPLGGTNYTTGNVDGNRLAQTPDCTLDFSLEYVIPTPIGDFTANFTYAYDDGWAAEADNRLRQLPYSIVDSQVAWHSSNKLYTVTLWGKNLLNTQYLVALDSQANGDFAQYAPPRTYGIRLRRDF